MMLVHDDQGDQIGDVNMDSWIEFVCGGGGDLLSRLCTAIPSMNRATVDDEMAVDGKWQSRAKMGPGRDQKTLQTIH